MRLTNAELHAAIARQQKALAALYEQNCSGTGSSVVTVRDHLRILQEEEVHRLQDAKPDVIGRYINPARPTVVSAALHKARPYGKVDNGIANAFIEGFRAGEARVMELWAKL